jgi:hypothetical protein
MASSSSEEANRIAVSGLAHVICGRQDQPILSYEGLALMVYVIQYPRTEPVRCFCTFVIILQLSGAVLSMDYD